MKEKKDRSSRKALFGLFLIIIGALWILFKLNFIPIVLTDILISWQMLLIGIGVFSMIAGNRTSGIVLIVIGSFFLIDELLIIPYHLRQFGWPVLIIGVGVVLIITHKMKSKTPRIESSMQGADFFDDFIIFGGKEVFVRTNNFLGGKITSIFGALSLTYVKHLSPKTEQPLNVSTSLEGADLKFLQTGLLSMRLT